MRHRTEVGIISALTEAGRQIHIQSKFWHNLDAENDAPGTADGASEVLRYQHCSHPAQIRSKFLSEYLLVDSYNPMDAGDNLATHLHLKVCSVARQVVHWDLWQWSRLAARKQIILFVKSIRIGSKIKHSYLLYNVFKWEM